MPRSLEEDGITRLKYKNSNFCVKLDPKFFKLLRSQNIFSLRFVAQPAVNKRVKMLATAVISAFFLPFASDRSRPGRRVGVNEMARFETDFLLEK